MRTVTLVFLVLPAVMCGQVGTATLSGTVGDATGAVVPSAQVILDNTEQQSRRTTVTGAEGQYVIPAISPGQLQADRK